MPDLITFIIVVAVAIAIAVIIVIAQGKRGAKEHAAIQEKKAVRAAIAEDAKAFYRTLKPRHVRGLKRIRTKTEAETYLRNRWSQDNPNAVVPADPFFAVLISSYYEPAREAHVSSSLAAALDNLGSSSGSDHSSHGASGSWGGSHHSSYDSGSHHSSYDGGGYSSSDSGGGSDGGGGGGGGGGGD